MPNQSEGYNNIPLNERRDIHLAQLCHKAVYEQPPNSLNHFFTKIQEGRVRVTRTKNSMNMKVPAFKCTKARRAFSYVGPNRWNKLDNDLKSTKNYNAFRCQLLCKYLDIRDNHPT